MPLSSVYFRMFQRTRARMRLDQPGRSASAGRVGLERCALPVLSYGLYGDVFRRDVFHGDVFDPEVAG